MSRSTDWRRQAGVAREIRTLVARSTTLCFRLLDDGYSSARAGIEPATAYGALSFLIDQKDLALGLA